jgi:hypothetical protein
MTTNRGIFLSHDLGRGPERPMLRPENPYSPAFLGLTEMIAEQMQSRTRCDKDPRIQCEAG